MCIISTVHVQEDLQYKNSDCFDFHLQNVVGVSKVFKENGGRRTSYLQVDRLHWKKCIIIKRHEHTT